MRNRPPSIATRACACLFLAAIAASTTGCATYKTISAAEAGTAKVFSGTRLDVTAIRGEQPSPRKFKAEPPQHPVADLPFSFALDLAILPLTLSSALYEVLFE